MDGATMTTQRIRRYAEFPDEFDADPDDSMPKQALQSTLANRPNNFVAPLPAVTAIANQERPAHPVTQFDLSAMPMAHTSEAIDQSDELQRSKGFVWRTLPLSAGFGAAVAAVTVMAGAPAVAAVAVMFLVFSATWAGAFIFHVNRSPSGIAYRQSQSLWGVIEREQRYRHSVDWHERTKGR